LEKFYSKWSDGELPVHAKSENIDKQEGNVVRLSTKTFWDNVLDEKKDVIVLFYRSIDDKRVKVNLNIFEELAKSIKNKNEIQVSVVDLNKNDLEIITIEKVPSIKLFSAGKDNTPYDYKEKDITLADLKTFLKKYAKNRVVFGKSDL